MPVPFLSLISGLRFGLEHITLPGWIFVGLLGLASMIAWSVILTKTWLLSRTRKADAAFKARFFDSSHPLTVYLTQRRYDLSPMYHVYHSASKELIFHLVGDEDPGRGFSERLQGAGRVTPSQMRCVEQVVTRALSSASVHLQARLGILTTVLGITPFLGLLGTVWGLLEVFATVAQKEQAGLAVVMPGAAASLITLLAALLVVLPCMVGANVLIGKIRHHMQKLEAFAEDLARRFEHEFVDHRQPAESLPSIGSLGGAAFSAAPRATPGPGKTILAE